MNLLEEMQEKIEKELQDTSTVTKIYYIYQTLCQHFRYDSRWCWAFGDEKLQDEIFNKELDITNVTDQKVVCSSFSKVFCELADILLSSDENYDISFLHGELSHCFAVTYLNDFTILELDPIGRTNDFLNAKKGLPLQGIKITSHKEDPIYLEEKVLIESGYNNTQYLRYLSMLGEEITTTKNYLNDPTTTLFEWFKDTTNFHGLGLTEANALFLLTVNKITNTTAQDLNFKRLVLYDPTNQEVKLMYKVPSTSEETHYTLEEQNNSINIKKVEVPILDYMNHYRTATTQKQHYLCKK